MLPPIKVSTDEFIVMEKRFIEQFNKLLYFPLLRILKIPESRIENAKKSALDEALLSGRVTFSYGKFSGKLNAAVSKELQNLGAKWNKKTSTFDINKDDLPRETKVTIKEAKKRVQEKFNRVEKELTKILPETITDSIKTVDVFDKAILKTDKLISKSLDNITVTPKLTPKLREYLAKEWRDNAELFIKKFAIEQITQLRDDVKEHVFSGGRFEDMISSIKRSYGVTQSKAKFLARQETMLAVTTFKQARYQQAGLDDYIWHCTNRNTRRSHKLLDKTEQKFSRPPCTNSVLEKGQKTLQEPRFNNPGQDYNCHCFAQVVVRIGQVKK